jgi:hypothetical protein
LCDQAESYWSKASTCSARWEISNSDIGQLRHSDVIHDYSKKLNSLNSSVMDDKYDTYKTANIEINQ